MPSPSSRTAREKWLDDQRTIRAFARIEPRSFGISCAIVGSLLLFAATVYLIQRGVLGQSDIPGENYVGSHLQLLAHVMPGYAVTWPGAFIGLVWGLLDGFVIGYLLAGFFNLHHHVYLRWIERRSRRRELLHG